MPSQTRLLLLVVGSSLLCCALAGCPPENFDSAKDLDIVKYMTGPWYSQQQVLTQNQKEDTLFCVKAEYHPRDVTNLSKGVVVLNYANKDTVNGEAVDTSANNSTAAVGALGANIPSLVAFPAPFNETSDSSTTAASKLKVGPGIFELPYKLGTKFLFGDYWVVAVGKSADSDLGYDWAVVTAGVPKTPNLLNGKCKTGNLLGTNQGLWLLSRKPVDPDNTATMRRVAEGMGLDISGLKSVTQAGCTYASLPGSTSSSSADSATGSGSSSDAGSQAPVGIAAVLSKLAAPKPADSKADQQVDTTKADTQADGKAAAPSDSKELDPLAITQKVELSISVGGKPAGTVNLGMFGNAAPKTVANFVAICKGSKGFSYKGSKFHRVIKNFMIQGGDFQNGDGTGGYSIYNDTTFPDENLTFQLNRGVIAMANSGPNSNGSQFFITVVPTDWLDGKHVVFGRVMRGMELVDAISDVDVNSSDAPLTPVTISGCRAWKDPVKTTQKPAQKPTV